MSESDDFTHLLEKALDRIRTDAGDKNIFLEKIDQESSYVEKIKILLQFLGNGYPNTKYFYTSNEIEMFLHQIFLITSECPHEFNLFMKWLPNFLMDKNKTIISIRKRVSKLQQQVKELVGYISTMNDSFDFNEFQNKESKLMPNIDINREVKIGSLDKKNEENNEYLIEYLTIINNLKNHIMKLKNELNKIEEREKTGKNQFFKINDQLKFEKLQNEQFQIQIESYKSKLEELQIENLRVKNFLDHNENSYQSNISQNRKNQDQINLSKQQNESNQLESEVNHLKNLLKNSQKEIECLTEKTQIFQNLINDLKNTENQSNLLKEKLFQLNEKNEKIRNENEENKKKFVQKIQKLKSSLSKIQAENKKLKTELQNVGKMKSTHDINSNNELLKPSFLNIESNNDKEIITNNEKMFKTGSASNSSYQFNSFSSGVSNEDNQLKYAINEKDKEINCLKRKIHLLEAEKIKLVDSLKKFQIQNNQNTDVNMMDMKKIGFLLADALCQRYNPSRVAFEINRLIEVARYEHIRLNESVRVPLDPFDHFTDNIKTNLDGNTRNMNNQTNNLFSGFDELDCQLSSMKSYM